MELGNPSIIIMAGQRADGRREAKIRRVHRWPISSKSVSIPPGGLPELWGPSEFTITGKLKDLDLADRIGEIREPMLLTGSNTDEADPRTVNDFQLAFPRAPHLHRLEQPGLYQAILRDFIARPGTPDPAGKAAPR